MGEYNELGQDDRRVLRSIDDDRRATCHERRSGGANFKPWMSRYVPPHPAGGRMCPGLTWVISQVELADKTINLSGPIWFEDGSGISFARGARQPDGRFTLDVKRQSGDGPTGTITGQRMPDGSIDATAAGPPCFEGTYHIEPGQTSTSTQ